MYQRPPSNQSNYSQQQPLQSNNTFQQYSPSITPNQSNANTSSLANYNSMQSLLNQQDNYSNMGGSGSGGGGIVVGHSVGDEEYK